MGGEGRVGGGDIYIDIVASLSYGGKLVMNRQ